MGGSAGGALAAAVSNGGGLGLLGSGNGDREWLARELPHVAQGTSGPWGVGFQSWAIDPGAVEYALRYEPRAIMLSFGESSRRVPRPAGTAPGAAGRRWRSGRPWWTWSRRCRAVGRGHRGRARVGDLIGVLAAQAKEALARALAG